MVAHPSTAAAFEFDDHNLPKLARRNISPTQVRQAPRNSAGFRRNKHGQTPPGS